MYGNNNERPAVFLVTGPSAAGKTTVSELLAKQFERGVHLESDFFRRSIVSGGQEMTPDASEEALEQLRLRYRLGALAADTYVQHGFTVVLEDVVAGPMLTEYADAIESRPLQIVCLMPSIETLQSRETGRDSEGYTHFPLQALYDLFQKETPRIGLWLDTSGQTADETVQQIVRHTREDEAERAQPAQVHVKRFEESEKPVLRSLMDDYLREFASLEHTEIEEDTEGHVVYDWFDAYWTDKSRTPFAVLVDEVAQGFALIRDVGNAWEVAEYYVTPSHRGAGVGGRAFSEIADWCRDQDSHSSIVAKVKPWNDHALGFWKAQGFQVQMRNEEWVTTVLPLEPR